MSDLMKSALKAGIGVGMALGGAILGFFGIRDLCFEKHEVGDIVNDVTEATEEEVF